MNFILKEYTQYYKFLLIEEIVLADSPAELHYGRCSVIGYLSATDVIQSLKIPNLQKDYQLPDGALSLQIHCLFHPKDYLHSTVQIFGEVRVIEKNRKIAVENFESSNFLIQRLRELQISLEQKEGKNREPSGTNDKSMSLPVRISLEKEINLINERYMPVIFVESIRRLQDARDVIYENLRYRQIKAKFDSVLRITK